MAGQRKFDNWLEAFLKYSGYGEAPEDCLFWTGVGTIAGALRRNVWIDEGYFQWFPNHYIVLVAPPGVIAKSTTMNIGFNLLREVPGIKFGPDSITWQALITAMAEAREDVAFPDGSFMPSCALTIASDEFGNLINMDDAGMLNILIAMFDAKQGVFEKVTKLSGNDMVPNPWLNFMACTTPSWIASGFTELTTQGGFVSRCLFIFADRKRRLIAYPSRHMPSNIKQLQEDLTKDLEAMSLMRGPFTLTDDAREYGEDLYRKHWNGQTQNLDMERFGGYWARKQTHFHKLAMVLSAAEGPSLRIERRHLELAYARVSATEPNLNRVFELIGRTADSRVAGEILSLITRIGTISRADLHAHFLARYGREEVNRGLDSCIAAGKLVARQLPDSSIVLTIPRPQAPQPQASAPAQTPAGASAAAPSRPPAAGLSAPEFE